MLREVKNSDFEKLYEWANEEEVKKNGYHPECIDRQSYFKWFSEKMDSPNAKMFIIEEDKKQVGELRLEKYKQDAIIVYSIDKDYRSKGIGKKAIETLDNYCKKHKQYFDEIKCLSAFVKADNIYSIRIFEKNEFRKVYESSKYIVFRKRISI